MSITRARTLLAAIALSAMAGACSDDDGTGRVDADPPQGTETGSTLDGSAADGEGAGPVPLDGVVRLEGGTRNAAEAIGELEAAIAENENLGLVAVVDHQANAREADESLPPTRVALFGNPRLGTPLMLANRTAGLDLPQRMLAFEDAAGALTVAWNDPAWMTARHGIEDEGMTVATISSALETLGARASGSAEAPTSAEPVAVGTNAGIVTRTSGNDFETTYAALVDAIAAADPLTLVRELDHSMNAASVGLELPPTRLLVFGNPALGTPLMQAVRTIGLDLPQKMLVWEDGDVVTIAWNDPAWLAARHGIEDRDELLERVAAALAGLADVAAGTGEDR